MNDLNSTTSTVHLRENKLVQGPGLFATAPIQQKQTEQTAKTLPTAKLTSETKTPPSIPLNPGEVFL